VNKPVVFDAGALTAVELAAGYYVYTGSARRNIVLRLARHLSADKKLHWHIDYLLARDGVNIVDARFYQTSECELNAMTQGEFPISGFGASDCVAGCISHLCYQGNASHYPEVK